MSGHDVILVRHGQTEWSASGKHTGRTDVPLTDLGLRQAAALGAMLAGQAFSLVLSSPLVRAWQTMERAGYGAVAVGDDNLMEWDYGVYEGRRTVEIRETVPGWSVWTHPITDSESIEEVGARADEVIERTLGVAGPVALFAHGHMLRVIAARWMALPAALVGRWASTPLPSPR